MLMRLVVLSAMAASASALSVCFYGSGLSTVGCCSQDDRCPTRFRGHSNPRANQVITCDGIAGC
ncbi:hypothetical protein Ptr902_06029 [Pyrenophora tritici-repentis]|uniref:Uncharacterized protein n=2 Tax=Pyrenophora tritici-repentis TaxID=45151 RepID=A0A5M9LCS8_9PLEO|nr:uncharacterized protein PTRG_11089 [Pyrenophora tritici-repentis Pt-1C-BFP]KAA8622219.1 hypothetical protein PtrV1_03525 [Pyrenophora tritici-repentis]EDU44139.1 hypothetical protein PTRG_11089 [Pyrenophora tritici-repentis Pt-1C-BFP]KAF7451199.1 hypothetical protein A1F99_029760 [Pyrenophora tritici-repentis]KAF7575691.1 hypothetical protein PtrM4_073150 [Pyrenophora tritici-repentis]KAI0570423.1 hypothetical protein Alg215_11059 [Pyrenophora tritici-repentis]